MNVEPRKTVEYKPASDDISILRSYVNLHLQFLETPIHALRGLESLLVYAKSTCTRAGATRMPRSKYSDVLLMHPTANAPIKLASCRYLLDYSS